MPNTQAQFQQAITAHQQGNLPLAESGYRQILAEIPQHFDSLHLLGVLHAQQGKFDQAIELIQQAVLVNPSDAGAYSNLGNAQLETGQLQEALDSYDHALRLMPQFPDALFNRGNALKSLGRFNDALASYNDALALVPTHANALINRGHVLQELGRDQEALASYEAALTTQPNAVNALVSYSHLQHKLGNTVTALQAATTALKVEDSLNTRSTFFNVVKGLEITQQQSDQLAPLLIRAMSEPWGRPYELTSTMISLIRQDMATQHCMTLANQAWPQALATGELFVSDSLQAVARNKALLCLLENAPATEIGLEKFLTLARNALLQHAAGISATASVDVNVLTLHCALARQCFINEYVFYCDENELDLAQALAQHLENTLLAGAPVSPLWIAAVACYFPLHSLTCAAALRGSAVPASVTPLLQQQIEEPLQETAYAPHIPRLSPVQDRVSQQVQQQYEENPYPRWIKYAPQRAKTTLGVYLKETFPHAGFNTPAEGSPLDYLIAGCGTGHQAIDVAMSFYATRIAAIDLSIKSLGYALRKTSELAIQNIEYAHADIMELGATGWRFDAIESVGVLHHMANPVAGWRVLASMLRPGGFMKLGFYSEIARRNLNVEKIPNHAYSNTDIRNLRHTLMLQEGNSAQYADIYSMRDFYGTSECRDLLFHVQEHRFNLLQIRDILAELGLRLLGFQLSAQVLNQYAERFPADVSRTDLESWHIFEQENPRTFIGMYQFWVQKADENP